MIRVFWLQLPDDVRRTQRFLIDGEGDFQAGVSGITVDDGFEVGSPPAEDGLAEFREVTNLGDDVVAAARQARQKPLMVGGNVLVDVGLRRLQGGNGNNESRWLD